MCPTERFLSVFLQEPRVEIQEKTLLLLLLFSLLGADFHLLAESSS